MGLDPQTLQFAPALHRRPGRLGRSTMRARHCAEGNAAAAVMAVDQLLPPRLSPCLAHAVNPACLRHTERQIGDLWARDEARFRRE